MSYIVNYSTSTKAPIIINTGTIDNSTSISLVGKNVSGFGEIIAENFLHILENFASATEPGNSVEGQLWYDTSDVNKKVLKIKSGIASDWRPVSNIYFQTAEPSSAVSGELWVKYEDNNLSFYAYVAGTGWVSLAESYVLISSTEPIVEDQGRLWFNTTNKKLFVYTSTWTSIQSPAVYGTSVPASDLVTGQIWYNTTNNTAFIYNGTSWIQLVASLTANDIPFIQAGAGAVSRSMQNKGREFITPQDYGAAGNGVSNDTAAFIAANAAAGGKAVLVPDATYVISGTITGNFVSLGNPSFIGGSITLKNLDGIVGQILMWPLPSPPLGYLLCNGSAVSRTTYAQLFSVLGTTFGVGDNSTTFNLPDYRNRVPIGAGNLYNAGSTGGSKDAVVVQHSHSATVFDPGHAHTYQQWEYVLNGEIDNNPQAGRNLQGDVTGASTTGITVGIGFTGVAGTDANLPPYLGMYFVIKF